MNSPAVRVRLLTEADGLQALTALVHRAYAPHLLQGMNFSAATQTVEQTRERLLGARCLVAEWQDRLVGTLCVCGPWPAGSVPVSVQVPWYFDPQFAHLHQFAVDPAHQGLGIGKQLLQNGEMWAQQQGFAHMALDTAVPATELRALYRRWGYRDASLIQWPGKTYASVVMIKALAQG